MSDLKMSAMMVDDCLHDPVLAAKVILGIKHVPPHQELRLWGMWTKPMFIDSSGFGTGKTINIAIVAALRSVLMPDRHSGILGRTFNQGKLIHHYFDRWIEKSPLFRYQIAKTRGGDPASTHLSDAWQVKFKNSSLIRTVPPDFARRAERVASESWTDGYFDEWTRYPNFGAFFKVILGRTRRPVDTEKCDPLSAIFTNHVCFFGTASYTWIPAYAVVEEFQQIKSGKIKPPPGIRASDYDYQSWNYKHYPPEFSHLLNLKIIRLMERTNPKLVVDMEVLGKWISDSSGYYSLQDVANARSKDIKVSTMLS